MKHYVYGLYKKNCEYKTYSLSENLFYVGITSGHKNLYFRTRNHSRDKTNPHKLNVIQKYDFDLKIIWVVNNRKEAEDREEFLIRWFKRIQDGGILTNFLLSCKDYSQISKVHSSATKSKISKALKAINKNPNFRNKNRDRNLSLPYSKIIELLDEWAKNPLESQQSFSDRHGIKRSMFKDWMRLYKPEYIGLTKKIKQSIAQEMYEQTKTKKLVDVFTDTQTKYSSLSYSQIKSMYYIYLDRIDKS